MTIPEAGRPARTLAEHARQIVECADPAGKAALAREVAALWTGGRLAAGGGPLSVAMPERPGRPARPLLLAPREMPRRSLGGLKGRIAMLHALTHIELNAMDLAWDLIGRFADRPLPRSFFDGAVRIGEEEARHFLLLSARLEALGARYGDLPAHAGLWEAASRTGDDLLARLAIVPLVFEARGLDVTPRLIAKAEHFGDTQTAAALRIVYREEKGHVAFGMKWFRFLCARRRLPAMATFQLLVRRHFRGPLKPPFNERARAAAGLTPGFYKPLMTIAG